MVYEDSSVIAIKDIHPVAPVHLLIIPKQHVDEFYRLDNNDLFVSIMKAIQHLIQENKISDKGYRIEVNGGGVQLVNHLHFHLIGPLSHAPKI